MYWKKVSYFSYLVSQCHDTMTLCRCVIVSWHSTLLECLHMLFTKLRDEIALKNICSLYSTVSVLLKSTLFEIFSSLRAITPLKKILTSKANKNGLFSNFSPLWQYGISKHYDKSITGFFISFFPLLFFQVILRQSLYLGGVPTFEMVSPFITVRKSFSGCIQKVCSSFKQKFVLP